jgi:hypothetical protein
MEIARYELQDTPILGPVMLKSKNGDFVRHQDAEALLIKMAANKEGGCLTCGLVSTCAFGLDCIGNEFKNWKRKNKCEHKNTSLVEAEMGNARTEEQVG